MIYNSFDNVGFIRVLSFLKSHNSEYVSGQDLSDVLKISRVAIWKHVKHLRELGYDIESKQKRGYKLVKTTELLLPWEITHGLKSQIIGKRVYFFDVIDSTQNFAKSIATNKKENGTVIVSQRQTYGKGRLDRKWISPQGGIWCSIILHPKFDVKYTTLFPIASSLALAKSIKKIFNKTPQVKWPNDVTLNGKKVAGMLVDLTLESNRIGNLILGIGINFKVDIKKLEKTLTKNPNFYGASTILKKTEVGNPTELVQEFFYELENQIKRLDAGTTKPIVRDWTKMSSTIGKNVTIITTDGKISGKAEKLDSDGALILIKNGNSVKILVGDIR